MNQTTRPPASAAEQMLVTRIRARLARGQKMSRPAVETGGLLSLALSALVGACGPARPAIVAEDREGGGPGLDVEAPFVGRIVRSGEDFLLSPGESVALGPHAQVFRWQSGGGAEPIVVDVVFQRVPPDVMPGGVVLTPGVVAAAGECSLLLIRTEAGEPARATLRVTCPEPGRR